MVYILTLVGLIILTTLGSISTYVRQTEEEKMNLSREEKKNFKIKITINLIVIFSMLIIAISNDINSYDSFDSYFNDDSNNDYKKYITMLLMVFIINDQGGMTILFYKNLIKKIFRR